MNRCGSRGAGRASCSYARQLARRLTQELGKPLIVAASLWLAVPAHAAIPVEDMSTQDVRPQVAVPPPTTSVPTTSAPTNSLPTTGPLPNTAASPSQTLAQVPATPNAQLFFEVQQLQSELAALRGLVEDQAIEIKRLRDLQRSHYLDIDQRLTQGGAPATNGATSSVLLDPSATEPAVAASSAAGPATLAPEPSVVVPIETAAGVADSRSDADVGAADVGTVSAGTGTSIETTTKTPGPVKAGEVAQEVSPAVSEPVPIVQSPGASSASAPASAFAPTEAEAYANAFELMKDQRFEESVLAYQQVLNNFPDGEFAPESRYWLGELYLMADRLEDARGSFSEVVEAFPAHQKVPLSMYKLGVVNHRLGVMPKALEYLENVVVRYPDTPAAGLARSYADELK